MNTPRPHPRQTYIGTGSTHAPPRARMNRDLIAGLATRLTTRDTWLLEMLHEHRVLTTPQIRDLAFPSTSTTTHRLLALWRYQAVDRFRPAVPAGSAPMHYVLGPAGATILATRRGTSTAELGYRPDRALAIAHSDKLHHLVGTNNIFTALAAHARTHPDTELLTWWSERRCTTAWGKTARPDGYGRWRHHHREIDFFVEYDTGTEPLHRLHTKISDYTELADMTGITNTPVLFALPNTLREHHLHAHTATRTALIATTTPTALQAAGGPAGAAWLRGDHTHRQRLIDLTADTPGGTA